MHLRPVHIHAQVACQTNVLMVYFALLAHHATIGVHFSAEFRGTRQRLPVPCPVKVDRIRIVLLARNAMATLPALILIRSTAAQALMKLLQLARILAQVVSTRSVQETRNVTSILPVQMGSPNSLRVQ